MKMGDIPAPTIKRLSLYLRFLEEFHAGGERTISSKTLGESLNLTDAQVRKDLAYFGPFGHPGIGYRAQDLIEKIRHILGTDRIWKVALVGSGNLGHALAAYRGFIQKGFQLVAAFDIDESKIGRLLPSSDNLTVQSVEDLPKQVRDAEIKLGIVAVPAPCAQQVADLMIGAGIKGILNFAPIMLAVPEDVSVAGVDLAVRLEQLSFRVRGAASENTVGG